MTKSISKIIVAIPLLSIVKVEALEILSKDSVMTNLRDEVSITATKPARLIKEIPGRIDIIG